jgi:hypothetical protein
MRSTEGTKKSPVFWTGGSSYGSKWTLNGKKDFDGEESRIAMTQDLE